MYDDKGCDTGALLFDAVKHKEQQLRVLVNLLADFVDATDGNEETLSLIEKTKSYLLIETNLGISFMTDENTQLRNT